MATKSLNDLIVAVRREADSAEFPVDEPVYKRAGRDPKDPILFAGTIEAPVCFVGRDLGKDEVAAGQPLIGAAGRVVRLGILSAWADPRDAQSDSSDGPPLQGALRHALLTNTVPYKPPGNKSYAESVRRRFRPFLQRLLADHWQGRQLITLGSEAFQWFEPYADPEEFSSRGKTDVRFDSSFRCRLPRIDSDPKEIVVFPLPHPSPLNRKWYDQFPDMLARRLAEIRNR
jgi:uracil-DNA glycosylase